LIRLSAPTTSTSWVKRRIKYLESGQPIHPISLLCVSVATDTPKYVAHDVHDMCVMMERELQISPLLEIMSKDAHGPQKTGPVPSKVPEPAKPPVLAKVARTGGPPRIREIFDPGGV